VAPHLLTGHAWERVAQRLEPHERGGVVLAVSGYLKANPRGSHAVRVWVLKGQRNEPWSDLSNGDEVWAIIRDGVVVTTMLRRSTQPKTCASLRVEHVHLLA
jgi:hypothetical protein